MGHQLTDAEINHLRRLLGWVECEAGQAPDEMVEMVRKIAPAIHGVSDEGKARLVEAHQKASNVPKYVRSAIKALRKTLAPYDANIVDAEVITTKAIGA
jgi:hypothetical protein